MAKSARAKSRKANNNALRARVFGPVDEARTNRLSAKLMALAAQPKPSEKAEEEAMELETDAKESAPKNASRDNEDMDIDENGGNAKTKSQKSPSKVSNRVHKKTSRRRASKASIVFPSLRQKGKGKGAGLGKTQGKKKKH